VRAITNFSLAFVGTSWVHSHSVGTPVKTQIERKDKIVKKKQPKPPEQMPFASEIALQVCRQFGHKIITLRIEEMAADGRNVIVSTPVVCEKCGASLKQIRGT
jgi:hypothetical protein